MPATRLDHYSAVIVQTVTETSTLLSVSLGIYELLERSRAGDGGALDELVTALYGELRRVASRHLRGERTGHTLQTTALVHEVYLKLAGGGAFGFKDRAHFLSVASRVMRQVLVDYARARATKKRERDKIEPLTTGLQVEAETGMAAVELLDLDAALEALAREDSSLAQVIEMRYFGGMTAEETAEALGQSVHIVRHDLRLAQAWLSRRLSQ
jgi:RNA polymerase sigma factor (TIGR02999 family)